ncbi:hypothetical protein HYW17_03395 [Candidatus Uhrbacteria bacterium]|nr:hypothetical protein [Candidatus Uhrbacteria bacterium]
MESASRTWSGLNPGYTFPRQRQEALDAPTVQRTVANYFHVTVADLRGPKRHRAISVPRQIAMYLMRQLCDLSYPEIGRRFGGMNHSTVITACRKTKARIQKDARIRQAVADLERMLQA